MKTLVSYKKLECWQRFCEENGEKDLWEVVKCAKDIRKLKEIIKTEKDKREKVLGRDQEKVEGIVRDTFRWDPIGSQLQEKQIEEDYWVKKPERSRFRK